MYDVLILVHGYNHTLSDWEQCMWGNPGANVYGRASQALRITKKYRNPVIFLGGGGVVYDDGVSCAEMTHQLILRRISEMYDEDSCPRKTLDARLHVDTSTRDTKEEIKKAFELCLEKSIPEIILVSSPTHSARCLMEALALKELSGYATEVCTYPSHVNYKSTSASDVVVIEPPHLPETPKVPFYRLVRRIVPFMKNRLRAESFAQELQTLIEKYEKKKK